MYDLFLNLEKMFNREIKVNRTFIFLGKFLELGKKMNEQSEVLMQYTCTASYIMIRKVNST